MVDATRNIQINVTDNGVTTTTNNLLKLAQNADLVEKAITRLAKSFKVFGEYSVSTKLNATSRAMNKMMLATEGVSPAIRQMTEMLKRLDSTLNASGMNKFTSSMKQATASMELAAREATVAKTSFVGLGGVMRTMLAYMGVRQIAAYADAWANLSGQISVVTDNEDELVAVRDRLFDVSQRVRQSVTEVTGLYGRMAIGGKDLGLSQEQLIKITENVSKTLSYSHVSAERASGALMQLSKSFSTPKIMARDFNSVLHTMPALVQQIADHMGSAGGSINKLRQLMLDKKLTNSEWAKAILAAGDDIDKMFGKAAPLISQGFAVIGNDAKKLFGTMNESVNIGGKLVALGQWAGEHLPEISSALLSIGSAAAVAFTPTVIIAFRKELEKLTIAAMRNPFIAAATAITAVTVAIYTMRNSIKVGSDGVVSLGDVFTSMSEKAGGFVNNISESVSSGISFVRSLFASNQSAYDNSIKQSGDKTKEFYSGVGNGMSDFFIMMAQGFDALATQLSTLATHVATVMALITKTIQDARVVMPTLEMVGGIGLGVATGGLGGVAGAAIATKGVFDAASAFSKPAPPTQTYAEIMQHDADQMKRISGNSHAAEDIVRAGLAGARRTALLRETDEVEGLLDQGATGAGGKKTAGVGGGDKAADKAHKDQDYRRQIMEGIQSLISSTFSTYATEIEKEKDNRLISDAVKHGLINPITAGFLGGGISQKYMFTNTRQDQSIEEKRSWDVENQELTTDVTSRKALTSTIAEEDRRRKAGLPDWNDARDSLMRFYTALQRARDAVAERDALDEKYNQSRYKAENKVGGIQDATRRGYISEQTGYSMRVSALADHASNQIEAGKGNSNDMMFSAVNKAREGFTSVKAGATSAMGGFFSEFTDGFSSSIGQAITGMQNFGQAVRNVAQGAVSSLISALVKLGIQWAITSAMGKAMASSSNSSVAPIVAQGAEVNAAWQQAAVNVSLATFGANAVPAVEGMAMANASSAIANTLGGLGKGFKTGGYTGDGGTSDIAGVVHGQEYVFNAETTARIGRETLDAISAGDIPAKAVQQSKQSTGGNNGDIVVHVPNINVNNPNVQDGKFDAHTQKKLASAIDEQVRISFQKAMVNNQRVGGQLSRTSG